MKNFLNIDNVYLRKNSPNRRSDLKVPSVSIYMHFPSPPPISMGIWHVTAMVIQSWDFPEKLTQAF